MKDFSYIVDSHCHLNYEGLSHDIDSFLSAARKRNVRKFLAINTRLSEFDDVHKIALQFEDVYCTVGVHPHESEHESISPEDIVNCAVRSKVVGIGETGLDYYHKNSQVTAQLKSFRAHLEAAKKTKLPLIIHTRNAEADTLKILKENAGQGCGVLHCFTSSWDLAKKAIELGYFISFSGIVTFKNASDVRKVAKEVPEDRLLVETDAPYLAPEPFRGKICQPAFVANTLEFLADLRKTSVEQLTQSTTRNFFSLFKKACL